MTERKKKYFWLKLILIISLLLIAIGSYFAYNFYKKIFFPNVRENHGDMFEIFIPTKSNIDTVKNILARENVIIDSSSFSLIAKLMKYERHIYPGRYLIKPNISNKELIVLFRSGKQTPLKLVLNNVRTKGELITLVCSKLETDSLMLLTMLNDTAFLQQYHLTRENAISIFIPNTYEFYWNTDAEKLFKRMWREYKRFWNEFRLEKAKNIHLEPLEIITLASIVEQETIKENEKKIIAGVYINRLKKGWKLQADPTVKFALEQFDLQRILSEHLEFDSPYNTYLYEGLPPGPICLPETKTIDAVLNYELHNYMYFCAKDDFSGEHNFAVTLGEHLANARRFQNFLNENRIY